MHNMPHYISTNAVSAFQISCKLLSFALKSPWRILPDDQSSSITKGRNYHIKYMCTLTFQHSSGLIRNFTCNHLYTMFCILQILRFYLVRQIKGHPLFYNTHKNWIETLMVFIWTKLKKEIKNQEINKHYII